MARQLATLSVLSVCLLAVSGCTGKTKLGPEDDVRVQARSRVGTTQGSSVAVTQDGRIAVLCNRTEGVISIVHLDPKQAPKDMVLKTPRTLLPIAPLAESKPWAAVIAPDDDTAYVLVRGLRKVMRIRGLHGSHPETSDDDEVKVGSEPTSIAISPSGKTLYVANSGDGTVSSIISETLKEAPWDLNWRLAATGLLGGSSETSVPSSVWSEGELRIGKRPALAHPRALALTDDGDEDDNDEMLFATEFFSQPIGDVTNDDPDRNRQGLVYPINVGVGAGNPPVDGEDNPFLAIPLAPVETGFEDAEGTATGCFPNQLYSAAAHGSRLYVTAVCASPAGPVEPGIKDDPRANNNFKTVVHSAVFTIDTTSLAELGKGVVLSKELDAAYTADDADRRMPVIPNEIVLSRDGAAAGQGYISAFGSSAIFPIRFDADDVVSLGAGGRLFIGLGSSATPSGMALLAQDRALVLDDAGSQLSVVDLSTASPARTTTALDAGWPASAGLDASELVSRAARHGRRLFATGLGAWSFKGQGWSSCESCHPEGGSDGVTWRFSRGPRRSLSLASTYFQDSPERRMLLWTANVDELHDVEAIARRVSGGVGGVIWKPYVEEPGPNCRLQYDGSSPAIVGTDTSCTAPMRTSVRHNGLNGGLSTLPVAVGQECAPDDAWNYTGDGAQLCDVTASSDWDDIDAFARTVRAPHAPTNLDSDLVEAGEALFKQYRCSVCHGGPGWTLSRVFYPPGVAASGSLPVNRPADAVADLASLYGGLRNQTFNVPAKAPEAFGSAGSDVPFRPPPPLMVLDAESMEMRATTLTEKLDFLYNAPAPPGDQIRCVLRSVGTFLSVNGGMEGVAPAAAPRVREVRRVLPVTTANPNPTAYEDQLAIGTTGFNIPSLVGVSAGAPYFHAGNARSLEEVFDGTFAKHHSAAGVAFSPTKEQVQALVSYLLSIDESGERDPVPVPPASELGFDPDLCAQYAGN